MNSKAEATFYPLWSVDSRRAGQYCEEFSHDILGITLVFITLSGFHFINENCGVLCTPPFSPSSILMTTWLRELWLTNLCKIFPQYFITRRSGRYASILLAPAEGWRAHRAPKALRALLGAFGPSSVGEDSKQNILNLVSKKVPIGKNGSN